MPESAAPPAAAAAGAERAFARQTAMAMAPAVLIAGIGGGMAFPIVPRLGQQLGLSLGLIGLILAANRIGRVVVSPLVGPAVDRYGGRLLLLLGLAAQQGALLLYIVAVVGHRPGAMFLLGRAVHGLASACVFVSSQTLALQAGGTRHRGYAGGIVRSAQAMGVPLGLVAGGVLCGAMGPVAAFSVGCAVTLVALQQAARHVPDLRAVGAATAPRPRLREALAMLRAPQVAALAAVNFAANFAPQGVVLALMSLMVEQRHIGAGLLQVETVSGLAMGLMTACMLVVTPYASRLADLPGRRAALLALGIAVMIPGMALLAATRSLGVLALSLALMGMGVGFTSPPVLTLLADVVPPARHGSAIGAMQVCGDVGAALGPLYATLLFVAAQPALFGGTMALLALTLPATAYLRRLEGHAVGSG